MRFRQSLWILVAGLALLAGRACFDESGGSGTGCPAGSAGCDCYGNGSCDGSLECTANDKCVDPGCVAGELNCQCNGGLCLSGLMCTPEDICRPEEGETDGNSGTGPSICDPEVGDGACDMCAKTACCEEAMACEAHPVCKCLSDCIAQGGGDCEAECGALPPEFVQVAECVGSKCIECSPACNPSGDAPACTQCAAEHCCAELDACYASRACQCMESCLAGGMGVPACRLSCGIMDTVEVPELADLQACAVLKDCVHGGDAGVCYAGG